MIRRVEYTYPTEAELDSLIEAYGVHEFLETIDLSVRDLFYHLLEEGFARQSHFPDIFGDPLEEDDEYT